MPPETKIPNNAEIDQALKEFEAKSVVMPQAPAGQMPTVADNTSGMVRLVMKLSGGAIKEQRQAEYVLLAFVIVTMAISFYLFFGGKSNISPINITDPALSLPAI
ncbi:hypothetical protein HYZ82_01495 [Candidatus Nomurabacteria bacterium]|nr:hypothetical protein [Candidatus Nomurabacteria bacterium]